MKKIVFGLVIVLFAISTSSVFAQTTTELEEPLSIAEEMPEFPGGQDKMIRFLAKKLKYPKEAIQEEAQGTVYVKFIVEKDGSLTTFEIVRGVQQQLDSVALSTAKLMPKWNPGKQGGKTARVQCVIPIAFALTGGYFEKKKD